MTEPILTPFLGATDVTVYQGDCIEVMRQMPENSVDAIVTDPPYGLEFMGRDWDGFGTPLGFQTWSEAWAREAFRALKPGGHLLAFAGTRTYHRMASGVEDAGFEIRDCIAWMYGSGFPKSLDVSKAIDKAVGAKREIVGSKLGQTGYSMTDGKGGLYGGGFGANGTGEGECAITAPATPDAEKWSGWGTALKPAFEPVVVARKPLIGTVAQNVLEHGTGAINVDGCRIGWAYDGEAAEVDQRSAPNTRGSYRQGNVMNRPPNPTVNVHAAGRWPANVTLNEDAAAMLDEQSGNASYNPDGVFGQCKKNDGSTIYGGGSGIPPSPNGVFGYGDRGGPSRFFYTAKASKKDRNTNGANNTHPTVKPTTLMRWLIRLVTPPGGIILDPFGGSGSTGVAARAEGVRCILIEREAEYLDIIRQRLDEGPLFANLD